MSNNIGYARVSTTDQSTDLQVDALAHAGTARIFIDHASGDTTDRPALTSCLEYLNPNDTLLVWRIDRLGCSITDLIKLVSDLSDRDIQFRSLTEAIDTSTPGGELVFHIFAALAQMERRLVFRQQRHASRGTHSPPAPTPPTPKPKPTKPEPSATCYRNHRSWELDASRPRTATIGAFRSMCPSGPKRRSVERRSLAKIWN